MMTPEQLAKYNAASPPPKPLHGRFSPDGQFFLCTDEQAAELDAKGWNTNPFEHADPYKPEDAVQVKSWGEIKHPKKAERVVGADTDGNGLIDKVFAKKPGRPKKA